MSFTQDFFTSRRNYSDGDTRIERPGVLWYHSDDNTIRVGDGVTPGGIILNAGGGGGGGGSYILPTASTTVKGGVKIDGTTITINNQVISGFSGNYNDLTNKPTIPTATSQLTNNSGFITLSSLTWGNITGKPIFATVATTGSYNDLTNLPVLFSGNYNDLTNKPNLATVATTGSYNDLINKPVIPAAQVQSNWTQTNNSAVDFIKNKPTFATVATTGSYNDLTNLPVLFSGNYNDLTNKPVLFSGNYNDLTNKPNLATVATTGNYNDLINKPTIPAAQIQSDWNQTNSLALDFIKNKPTLFSGNYNDLTNKPNLAGTYSWSIAADDSTLITVNSGESIKIKGGAGISTSSDLEGNITITGFDGNYNSLTNRPTLSTVANTGNYNDLINKPDLAGTYTWNIAADDSTVREIKSAETVKFVGLNGITTISDSEGNIYISGSNVDLTSYATINYVDTKFNSVTHPEQYKFSVAADDSTTVEISKGETVQFVGVQNITTSVNSEGKITITGPDLTSYALDANVPKNLKDLLDVQLPLTIPSGYVLKYNGTKWTALPDATTGGGGSDADTLDGLDSSYFLNYNNLNNKPNIYFQVAADDSTVRTIENNQTIQFIGTNGITTTSNANGVVTITGTTYDLTPYATTALVKQELDKKLDKTDQYKFSVAADDSTQRVISTGETVKFIGTNGISTSTDAEGNVTITGSTVDLTSYATIAYVDNKVANIDVVQSQQFKFNVAADDSTVTEIKNGETVQIVGGTGISTVSDTEGKITVSGFSGDYNDLTNKPDLAGTYSWNIAADDSTARTVSAGETIKISGGQGVTTNSDAEGNITINGPDLQDLPSVDIDTGNPIPVGYVLKWNGSKWVPAVDNTATIGGVTSLFSLNGDDSVQTDVPLNGNLQVIGRGGTQTYVDTSGDLNIESRTVTVKDPTDAVATVNLASIKFTGPGVTVSNVGDDVTVNINISGLYNLGANIDGGAVESVYLFTQNLDGGVPYTNYAQVGTLDAGGVV